jgi:PmbA protein
LAEPDGVAVVEQDLWREELLTLPTADKIALAKELERLTLAADSRVRVDEADYADVRAEGAVATSTGIATAGRETGAYLSVSTLADDGDVTHTGFGFTVGRSPADFDPERAAREAAERATRLLGATKPSTGKVTVVLDPFVSAQFLGIIGATLNGEAVLKGRSIFAGRIGEDVAATGLTLIDDPTNPLAYTASEIDGEGLATRRNVLIDGGVLQMFVQSSYSARRSGAPPTGNATRGGFKSTPGCGCLALSLVPGTRSQAELVADVDEGVLVQMVQGLHSGVNPVSGDFSTGASGLMIRGGALAEPVREFTIASTLQKMLKDVAEVGGDVEWLPMSAAGVSLVIRDVTMSGA